MVDYEQDPLRSPEQLGAENFEQYIRESLDRVETPAPNVDTSEKKDYSDRDSHNRHYRTDGTVVFSNEEKARQLQVGENHKLALAYHEVHDVSSLVIYQYDDEGDLLKRAIFKSRGARVYKFWLAEKSNMWRLRPTSLNSEDYMRTLGPEEIENLGQILQRTVVEPESTELTEELNGLLTPTHDEKQLIEFSRMHRKRLADSGKKRIENIDPSPYL